jgi:hypothetical protein
MKKASLFLAALLPLLAFSAPADARPVAATLYPAGAVVTEETEVAPSDGHIVLQLPAGADDGSLSFVAGPIIFGAPAAREPVTGDMETDPKKDLPPLSWKLVGQIAGGAAALALLVTALVLLVRYAVRRVREHRMSPIERAWVELDRLLRKGLPGRGRYKDFYVELTMVVRRYVQRKYGVQAPHLTTEEFLRACGSDGRCGNAASLGRFLASADMVKFAGVEATPEMADDATASARGYLTLDARGEGGK